MTTLPLFTITALARSDGTVIPHRFAARSWNHEMFVSQNFSRKEPDVIKPILVLGSGRNGSTLLMSLFGGHPAIAFDRRYPYESTYISYFAKLAKVPTMDAKAAKNWSRQDIVGGASPVLGPIPFRRGYIPDETLSLAIFTGVWQGFSETLWRAAQERGEVAPIYYAEKTSAFAVPLAETIPGTKKVHLLRDPRDVLISSREFNRKRGTLRFGWRKDDTDATYAKRMVPQWKSRLQTLAGLGDGTPQEIVVRYEDMVNAFPAEARRLSGFLGVELDPENAVSVPGKHMTSATPGVSLERWRKEMDPEALQLLEQEIGEQLRNFRYKTLP